MGTIAGTDYGYTFQQMIANTGLMDYDARAYDPWLGRFIQPDSIVPDTQNPQAHNRYEYVENNPIILIDPSGHRDCDASGKNCVYYDYTKKTVNKNSISTSSKFDITNWLVQAANYTASYDVILRIKASPQRDYLVFRNLVKDGAKFDVKDKILGIVGEETKIGNGWYEYSTAGNFLYGYYGAAAGYSIAELRVGAGLAQLKDYYKSLLGIGDEDVEKGPLFPYLYDTPDDYAAVTLGYSLYEENSELTVDQLVAAFDNAPGLAVVNPPYVYEEKEEDYPVNKFFQ